MIFQYILSYLIGTFPSGVLIARCYGINLSATGSGNIGATNVARTLGKMPGILTLLLDASKGILAVLVISKLGGDPTWHAFSVVLGHCVSIPKVLKGGKGAATSLGAIFALDVGFGLYALGIFFAVFSATRIVSLSSIVTTSIIALFWTVYHSNYIGVVLMAVVVIARHHENIVRLSNNEEKKFSFARR